MPLPEGWTVGMKMRIFAFEEYREDFGELLSDDVENGMVVIQVTPDDDQDDGLRELGVEQCEPLKN